MRRLDVCTIAAAGMVWLTGCQQQPQHPARGSAETAADHIDEDTFNALAVRTAFRQQSRDAVVVERSIYGYHFDPGGTSLNELGERQVDILAGAYRHAEKLEVNLADDGSDAGRRASRIEAVRQAFTKRGLSADAIDLAAGRPGGRGLPSAFVARVLSAAAAPGGDARESGSQGSGGSRGPSGRSGSAGAAGSSSGMRGSSGSYSGGR